MNYDISAYVFIKIDRNGKKQIENSLERIHRFNTEIVSIFRTLKSTKKLNYIKT